MQNCRGSSYSWEEAWFECKIRVFKIEIVYLVIKGHEPRIIFNDHIYTHFVLPIHLAISLFISCFHFHAIASMATHAIHSIPIVPNPIFIFLNTLLKLIIFLYLHHASQGSCFPYLYLHGIVSWISCFLIYISEKILSL